MIRAVVVKSLTDQIHLARTGDGELISLSIPCRTVGVGSLVLLKPAGERCPVHRIDGKLCRSVCRRGDHAIIIDHKDTGALWDGNLDRVPDRHAI